MHFSCMYVFLLYVCISPVCMYYSCTYVFLLYVCISHGNIWSENARRSIMSNYNSLKRGEVNQNILGWYTSATKANEAWIVYLRDDENRDLLVEIKNIQRGHALLNALQNDQYQHPVILGEAYVWYFEPRRQLCASVESQGALGIAEGPARTFTWKCLDLRTLTDWTPSEEGNAEERFDFFVFEAPDPSSWTQKIAKNGSPYAQLDYDLDTGKVTQMLWLRTTPEDLPKFSIPASNEGTQVCLTNIHVKLVGSTVCINSTPWSTWSHLEIAYFPQEVSTMIPEKLVVRQVQGDVAMASPTPAHRAPPRASWIQEEHPLPEPRQKKLKEKEVQRIVQPETSWIQEEHPLPEPRQKKLKEKKVQRIDRPETQVALPQVPEPSKVQAEAQKVKEVLAHKNEPFDDMLTAPKRKKVGNEFPHGKKGSDYVKARVYVPGRGHGVITGGGAIKIRIIFDDEKESKNESTVQANKVRLL